MRKPWEEAGSHRDDFGFEDRPRRSDRRFDRREDGFGRRDDNFARRDKRRDDRRGGFSKRRDDFTDNLYGVRSGPRARAAMAGRGTVTRRQAAPSRNALITLDADVARVFATSEAVNAALRHLIALAGIMGEEAIRQATRESENTPAEEVKELPEESAAPQVQPVAEFQTTDEDEEWFDLPVEGDKAE